MSDKNPLIELYGENAFDLASIEIKDLAANSNIPFDEKYIELGISFLMINAGKVVEGENRKESLKSLVTASFGEAAIYKYNVARGVL